MVLHEISPGGHFPRAKPDPDMHEESREGLQDELGNTKKRNQACRRLGPGLYNQFYKYGEGAMFNIQVKPAGCGIHT